MRKSKPKKRILLPDPKFNDVLVTRFVNDLMVDGKKSIALSIFYDAIDIVEEKMAKKEEKPALDIWKQALENITPQVEVKSRRVGGATFQVPMEINPIRKRSISVKNMILFARKRSGKGMAEKLAAEIMAAYKEEGAAFKKKEDIHRMAEANRAFAHFRFYGGDKVRKWQKEIYILREISVSWLILMPVRQQRQNESCISRGYLTR